MKYSTLLPKYLSIETYSNVGIKFGVDVIIFNFQQARGFTQSYIELTVPNKENSD